MRTEARGKEGNGANDPRTMEPFSGFRSLGDPLKGSLEGYFHCIAHPEGFHTLLCRAVRRRNYGRRREKVGQAQ